MKPPVEYVALFSQVSQMNVSGKSFKAFVGEATQVVIHPESSQVAVPEPLCGNSVSQFHQDILLVHFTDYAFCNSEEVGLVDERRKNERVNPSRGFEPARFDQLDDAWASIMPGSAQAEHRHDFLSWAKFPGRVSRQKPGIGLLM
jgi:hypothetical protein